jgi:hypothetical protein
MDSMDALVDRWLVRTHSDNRARKVMLPSLREFAAAMLEEDGPSVAKALCHRHASCFLELAEAAFGSSANPGFRS